MILRPSRHSRFRLNIHIGRMKYYIIIWLYIFSLKLLKLNCYRNSRFDPLFKLYNFLIRQAKSNAYLHIYKIFYYSIFSYDTPHMIFTTKSIVAVKCSSQCSQYLDYLRGQCIIIPLEEGDDCCNIQSSPQGKTQF